MTSDRPTPPRRLPIRTMRTAYPELELERGELGTDYLAGATDGLKSFADQLLADRAVIEWEAADGEPVLSIVLELLELSVRKLEALRS